MAKQEKVQEPIDLDGLDLDKLVAQITPAPSPFSEKAMEVLAQPRPLSSASPAEIEAYERKMEELSLDIIKKASIQDAFVKAGIPLNDQLEAKPPKSWIFNEKINNLSPQVEGFLPREEGMFLYTPDPSMPVTDDNKQLHIDLCKQRVNTQAISAIPKVPGHYTNDDGVVAQSKPMRVEEARSMTVDEGAL